MSGTAKAFEDSSCGEKFKKMLEKVTHTHTHIHRALSLLP